MGDLSLLVRQELPANIRPGRPQPATAQPPAVPEEDNTGFAVFSGRTGQVVTLNMSYSSSFSRSLQQEKSRLVDKVRVKQQTTNESGATEISEENYIDVDVPKEILTTKAGGEPAHVKYASPVNPDDPPANVEVLATNIKQNNPNYVAPSSGGGGTTTTVRINRRPLRR
jgi:hypothetical protein